MLCARAPAASAAKCMGYHDIRRTAPQRTPRTLPQCCNIGRMSMRRLRVTIPDGVEFADLRLSRNVDDGFVRFAMAPIEAICEASALDLAEIVHGPNPLVGQLIAAWYEDHLKD